MAYPGTDLISWLRARAPRRRANSVSGRRRPFSRRLSRATALALAGALVASVVAAGAFIVNTGDVYEIDEAIYRAYNPGTASGSGVFDAFVQIGGNTSVTQGYNTDHAPQFDEGSSNTHNHAYRLSNVPTIFDPDLNTLTREFQLDVNQNTNNDISLDEVEVYLTDCRWITAYPFEPWTTPYDPATQCLNQSTTYSLADLVYELDKVGDDPAGDNWLELDDDISAGSGKRDLLLRIPQANFLGSDLGDDPACQYQGGPPAGAACATFVVLYAHFGEDAEPPLGNTDGFEEWGVELYDLATKSGTKFNDLDGDGAPQEAGEPGLAGWTIYVDYDNSGTLTLGEPSAVTAADGTYTISGIVPGTYNVREVAQAGWTCSFPNPCLYNEEFLAGADLTGNDFGNFQQGTKSGAKFEDENANGTDDGAGDANLAGWTIKAYNDNDSSGDLSAGDTVAATDVTDGTGYSFSLDPGDYVICEVAQAGWTQSAPANTICDDDAVDNTLADGGWAITITSGSTDTGNDFGNWTPATKSGFKFNDNDMDGNYEPAPDAQNDTTLANWVIELWKWDGAAWVFVASDTTDLTGYSFTGLTAGVTYAVCEISQTDWVQSFPYAGATLPAGESVFDCTQLTPNGGGTFSAFGIHFTATSGATLTGNLFGNFLVPPGCSLTQGYWKTHSIYGPAAHPDDAWYLLGALGPDTPFFDTGDTWYEVFWTTPKGGNAYYILAHQYMAAILNQLNGAGNPAGLATNLANAEILLDYYDDPPFNSNIPKNADNVLVLGTKDRAEAITIAGFLASYNEGTLPGTSHCGEENFAGFTTIAGLSGGFVWPIALVPLASRLLRRRAA